MFKKALTILIVLMLGAAIGYGLSRFSLSKAPTGEAAGRAGVSELQTRPAEENAEWCIRIRTDEPSRKEAELVLKVRNASYPMTEPNEKKLNEYYELRERGMTLPVDRTALILIDTWDVRNERLDYPELEAPAAKIQEILDLARKAGMVVIHAPHRIIGWDGVDRTPASQDFRGFNETPREKLPEAIRNKELGPDVWPPAEFAFRVGAYSQYARYSYPLYIPAPEIRGLHPLLLPQRREKEYIISDYVPLKEVLRKNKILHLLYVGGATNICIMQRPVGIMNMARLGYNILIVRDATMGGELYSTREELAVTKAAIQNIEILYGFSVGADNLCDELARAASSPPS